MCAHVLPPLPPRVRVVLSGIRHSIDDFKFEDFELVGYDAVSVRSHISCSASFFYIELGIADPCSSPPRLGGCLTRYAPAAGTSRRPRLPWRWPSRSAINRDDHATKSSNAPYRRGRIAVVAFPRILECPGHALFGGHKIARETVRLFRQAGRRKRQEEGGW